MRKAKVIGCGVVVLLLLVAAVVVPAAWKAYRCNRHERELQDPQVYQQVAPAMAKYWATHPDTIHSADGSPWLPAGVPRIVDDGPFTLIYGDEARVEFGGGSHHYGYSMKRDPQRSTSTLQVYELSFYSESRYENHLMTVTFAGPPPASQPEYR